MPNTHDIVISGLTDMILYQAGGAREVDSIFKKAFLRSHGTESEFLVGSYNKHIAK